MRGLIVGLWLLPAALANAGTIGMGHMVREGHTRSHTKGFYVAVMNQSPIARTFNVRGIDSDMIAAADDVKLHRAQLRVPPHRTVRLLTRVVGLTPGQPKSRYVCINEENHESTRICTRLVAHRLPAGQRVRPRH